jgi:hypothetical protein
MEILDDELIDATKVIIGCQIDTALKQAFVEKCKGLGGTSHVLRELIVGFADNRVLIKRPKEVVSLYSDEFV